MSESVSMKDYPKMKCKKSVSGNGEDEDEHENFHELRNMCQICENMRPPRHDVKERCTV